MSLKKIAEMTGVSPSTVSRVLHGAGNCAGKEVRERIWAAAREIQYVPNASAQALKRHAGTDVPALHISVVLGRFGSIQEEPFFDSLFQQLQSELLCHNAALQTVLPAGDFSAARIGACNGILLLGRCTEALLKECRAITENIVGIWRNPTNFEIDEVVSDGEKAAAAAMDYLLGLGHKQIAYIGDCTNESRYVGYCKALINHNLPLDYSRIEQTNQTRSAGSEAMEHLLRRKNCTAVLCANDASGLGALETLKRYQHSKKYPVSVISIDNIAESARCAPPLTTINIPGADMAHMAVQILMDRIEGRHSEHIRVELPCRLIVRDSCYLV